MRLLWVEADPRQHESCRDILRAKNLTHHVQQDLDSAAEKIEQLQVSLCVLSLSWNQLTLDAAHQLVRQAPSTTRFVIVSQPSTMREETETQDCTPASTLTWPIEILGRDRVRIVVANDEQALTRQICLLVSEWVGAQRNQDELAGLSTLDALRQVIDRSPLAIVTTTPEGAITTWNDTAATLFGWSAQEVIGDLLLERIQCGCDTSSMAMDWDSLSERFTNPQRVQTICADGRAIDIDISVAPLHQFVEFGNGLVWYGTPVSNEPPLISGLDLRHHAFEVANQGILIVDARQHDFPIVYCNAAFLELTGYTKQETLGRNCRFLQGNDRNQEAIQQLRDAISNGTECTTTLRNYRKDGSLFWNELHLVPVRDESDSVTHFLGFQNDVSKQVIAENRLRENDGQDERLGHLGSIDTIASALAHELTQPLGAAANYAGGCIDLLDMGLVQPAELTDKLNKLNEQIARSGDIIRRLRSYVSQSSPERSPQDMPALVSEVIRTLDNEIKSSEVIVELEFPDDLPLVPCESRRIQQVFVNLMRNALDAMQSVKPESRKLTIGSTLRDNVVTISIHDSGPGLDADSYRKIFEPYFTTKPDGLGMGLGICRTIVTNHGGSIWAEMEPEGGAVFRFTLPVQTEPDASPNRGSQ